MKGLPLLSQMRRGRESGGRVEEGEGGEGGEGGERRGEGNEGRKEEEGVCTCFPFLQGNLWLSSFFLFLLNSRF
jgi:hypothetical protein